ncbi:hypothetical protein ACTSKR_03175 [Chitinibacteraceae bacterium HSL-7]
MRISHVIGVVIWIVWMAGGRAESSPRQITVAVAASPVTLGARMAVEALRTAYERLGYVLVIERQPGKRALASATSGAADGELARIRQIGEIEQRLIRVDVPLLTLTQVLLLTPGKTVDDRALTVAYVRGQLASEQAAGAWPKHVAVTQAAQGLKMLDAKRFDALVLSDVDLYQLGLYGQSPVRYQQVELRSDALFHYLNRRHAALVPRLEAELRAIKGRAATVAEGQAARTR